MTCAYTPVLTGGRAHCYLCDRPQLACICASIQPVVQRTALTLLQHPRERRHPLGTLRLARLGLTRLQVEICWQLRASLATQARALVPGTGVLYPHPSAQALSAATPPPTQLIVLDGTWSQARSLWRANPWLQGLPHYSIQPDGIDRYRVRREPASHCTSTLEAIVHALALLEPETEGLQGLLAAFTGMIDAHVQRWQQRPSRRRTQRPDRPRAILPAALMGDPDLVLVGAEWSRRLPPPSVDGVVAAAAAAAARLIYLVAYRPRTGASLALAGTAAGKVVSPEQRAHLALPEAALAHRLTASQVAAVWAQFCPPTAVCLAWYDGTLTQLQQAGLQLPASWAVKTLYANAVRRAPGSLHAVMQQEALESLPLPMLGRAAQRLGATAAIWRQLQERAAVSGPLAVVARQSRSAASDGPDCSDGSVD